MQITLEYSNTRSRKFDVKDKDILDIGSITYQGETFTYVPSPEFRLPVFRLTETLVLPDDAVFIDCYTDIGVF